MRFKVIVYYYLRFLVPYSWLAINTTFYFVLIQFTVYFLPNAFTFFFIISTMTFFELLTYSGLKTYSSLSKSNKLAQNYPYDSVENGYKSFNSSGKNGRATDAVFYRIYEVVAALSIYEASRGVIFLVLTPNMEVTPLHALYQDPLEFLMFLIFIVTSIQFIVGVSKHFESEVYSSNHMGIYTIMNYLLVVGEAISLLAMGISVSQGNFAIFSLWFIALLVIDYFWILLFKILRVSIYGLKVTPVVAITDIQSTSIDEVKSYLTVYKYWIASDIAFIIYLSIMDPIAKGYMVPPENFYNIFFILLLIGVLFSTVINSKCLYVLG